MTRRSAAVRAGRSPSERYADDASRLAEVRTRTEQPAVVPDEPAQTEGERPRLGERRNAKREPNPREVREVAPTAVVPNQLLRIVVRAARACVLEEVVHARF